MAISLLFCGGFAAASSLEAEVALQSKRFDAAPSLISSPVQINGNFSKSPAMQQLTSSYAASPALPVISGRRESVPKVEVAKSTDTAAGGSAEEKRPVSLAGSLFLDALLAGALGFLMGGPIGAAIGVAAIGGFVGICAMASGVTGAKV